MMKWTLPFIHLLFSFCALCVTGNEITGPCRTWYYKSCPPESIVDGWVCTSVEDYYHFYSRNCFLYPNSTLSPPPSKQCLLVNDVCQFSHYDLQCAFHQFTTDYQCKHHCVEVNGNSVTNGNSSTCRLPPPNNLCLPINGQCSTYNPCKYWQGFCRNPYKCGIWDAYYRFKFGPQPMCSQPPKNYKPPAPPGKCFLINNTCSWSASRWS